MMHDSWPPWYVWASILFTQWAFWFSERRSEKQELENESFLSSDTIGDPSNVAEKESAKRNEG